VVFGNHFLGVEHPLAENGVRRGGCVVPFRPAAVATGRKIVVSLVTGEARTLHSSAVRFSPTLSRNARDAMLRSCTTTPGHTWIFDSYSEADD